jgi:hypothetical protein
MLGPRDVRKALVWLRTRLPAARPQSAPQERALGRLFRARDRVRERHARQEAPTALESAPPPDLPDRPSAPTVSSPGDDPHVSGVDLARLRAAKERARRQH